MKSIARFIRKIFRQWKLLADFPEDGCWPTRGVWIKTTASRCWVHTHTLSNSLPLPVGQNVASQVCKNSGCTRATFRNSLVWVLGHCISHQLMGTIWTPGREKLVLELGPQMFAYDPSLFRWVWTDVSPSYLVNFTSYRKILVYSTDLGSEFPPTFDYTRRIIPISVVSTDTHLKTKGNERKQWTDPKPQLPGQGKHVEAWTNSPDSLWATTTPSSFSAVVRR